MRRNSGAVRYAAGMSTSRVGLTNMYIYGGGILSIFTFLVGLLTAGDPGSAINLVVEFYLMKLVPWPIDELLAAQTIAELVISHVVTIGVGLLFATSKWWKNV
jgi:hypothetical protein